MQNILRRYSVNWIWHFTDQSNLESIKKHCGLLSYKELQNRGISIPSPGGNQWSHDADLKSGVDDFVHLCFCNSHPMLHAAMQEGRIKHPHWLKIDAKIVLNPDVRFTADVSNKAGVCILDHKAAVDEIDFNVIYTWTDWNDPVIQKRRQAGEKSEILVPKIVPINKIENL